MSKRIFSEEQIKTLLQNENVARCSDKSISYHKDFKVSAVEKYRGGLPPNEIFRQAKFDIDMIGRKTPKRCLQSWRRIFKNKGIQELSVETRGRGKGGGRPKTNWSNEKEKIKYLEAEVAYLKAENDFLAKLRKKEFKLKPCQKYQIIRLLKRDIRLLCNIAKASKSGYYRWLKCADEKDKDYGDYLLVKEIFEAGKAKYGWRQIRMNLERKRKIVMNHKKIIRIMKKYNLVAKIRRRNPYKAIMKKTAEHRTFENQLDRNFNQIIPHKFFCTDITYLFFNNRVAYLSVVKDIATGEIVAWHFLPHITMELVLGTIRQMEKYKDALIHSDQGFHYTNPEYIEKIKALEMIQSMSRKGNCIDNAPIESFFGHLKDDVDCKSCKAFEELKLLIENYVKYYNHERAQWDLNKMTPVEYRDHLLAISA